MEEAVAKKGPPVWFIPAIVFGVIIMIASLIAVLFFGVMYMLKNSEAYEASEMNIRQSAEVRNIVGDITELDDFPSGSVKINNGNGTAEFSITVHGTKGDADTTTKLSKSPDKAWVIESFQASPGHSGHASSN